MKHMFSKTVLACFTLLAVLPAQNVPTARVVQWTALPPAFYKAGEENFNAAALSTDGRRAVFFQASFVKNAEGRAWDARSGRVTGFWKSGELAAGKTIWHRSGGMLRLSADGSTACFPVFPGNAAGQSGDPWSAAVAVDRTTGPSVAKLFDLKAFLIKQNSDIDGARGVTSLDMNADGTVIYAVVPFHQKKDSDYQRSYPVRQAIIEINSRTNGMLLHSVVSQGEQYFPFLNLTTNDSGRSFAFKGAGAGGKGLEAYVFTADWTAQRGFYAAPLGRFSGVNTNEGRGGPVLMRKGDGPWLFAYPAERGPVCAYSWKSKSTLKFGADKGAPFLPQYADSRFASGDGDHVFYQASGFFVWYPLQDKPYRLAPPKGTGRLEVPSFNNSFMSEDGSSVLLLESSGNIKRYILARLAAP